MAGRLEGNVAIVTRGGRGFGRAIANPDVQRWRPGMAERLIELREQTDPAVGLARCAEFCLRLASGECDVLSGQYIDVREDLDEKLCQAAPLVSRQWEGLPSAV